MNRVLAHRWMMLLALCLPVAVHAADLKSPTTNLTAEQIVEKHIAARGGLSAWHAVQTISYTGKLEAGGKENPELPFVLDMKRGFKSRMELQFAGQTAIQVYDGTNGWKLRPFLNRHQVESFTPDEQKAAAAEADLDGRLIDYAAKGSKVELVGTDRVGDHSAYQLKLTMRTGVVRNIWIDSSNFLEVKEEGSPRRMDGKMRPVSILYSDFRPAPGGLVVPYQFETIVDGSKASHKIKIESVLVNPPLDDKLFAKPN